MQVNEKKCRLCNIYKKICEKYTYALIDNNYYSVLSLLQGQTVAQLLNRLQEMKMR